VPAQLSLKEAHTSAPPFLSLHCGIYIPPVHTNVYHITLPSSSQRAHDSALCTHGVFTALCRPSSCTGSPRPSNRDCHIFQSLYYFHPHLPHPYQSLDAEGPHWLSNTPPPLPGPGARFLTKGKRCSRRARLRRTCREPQAEEGRNHPDRPECDRRRLNGQCQHPLSLSANSSIPLATPARGWLAFAAHIRAVYPRAIVEYTMPSGQASFYRHDLPQVHN
jgi:hypothetical protein